MELLLEMGFVEQYTSYGKNLLSKVTDVGLSFIQIPRKLQEYVQREIRKEREEELERLNYQLNFMVDRRID
jgi:molybdenum-dependent DNA-binding transcriptional regulator ModE